MGSVQISHKCSSGSLVGRPIRLTCWSYLRPSDGGVVGRGGVGWGAALSFFTSNSCSSWVATPPATSPMEHAVGTGWPHNTGHSNWLPRPLWGQHEPTTIECNTKERVATFFSANAAVKVLLWRWPTHCREHQQPRKKWWNRYRRIYNCFPQPHRHTTPTIHCTTECKENWNPLLRDGALQFETTSNIGRLICFLLSFGFLLFSLGRFCSRPIPTGCAVLELQSYIFSYIHREASWRQQLIYR